jgi:hypothetical protein
MPRSHRLTRRLVVAGVAATALTGFRSVGGLLAPAAELWERWLPHAPAGGRRVDWSAYDAWLLAHVVEGADGITRVRYAAAGQRGASDLARIVDTLAAETVADLTRAEQMAYWINLYNAVTLRTVLDAYPVESIQDIDLGGGLFSSGPLKAKLVRVEGEALSLDDIEHRILRPIWNDARIHYAVNCAALGCPNLRRGAWLPQTLDGDLEAAARGFINHPRAVRRGQDGRLVVSKIYDWFAEDFGGSEAVVLSHLRDHATADTRATLDSAGGIGGTAYDWALNDAPR